MKRIYITPTFNNPRRWCIILTQLSNDSWRVEYDDDNVFYMCRMCGTYYSGPYERACSCTNYQTISTKEVENLIETYKDYSEIFTEEN